MRYSRYKNLCSFIVALSLLNVHCTPNECSCSTDDLKDGLLCGELCVQMVGRGDFLFQTETRAPQEVDDLSPYAFELSNGQRVDFAEGVAVVAAGTYTLSATNAASVDNGYAGAFYAGTSEPFTIVLGDRQTVELPLGPPQNARLSLAVLPAFEGLYSLTGVSLTDGVRTQQLAIGDEIYFPVPASGQLTYAITATAKAGSHAEEFQTQTGQIAITAGRHHTLSLSANPLTGYVTLTAGAEHGGVFE